MNIPICPNVKTGGCEKSNLRILGENFDAFVFCCSTCGLLWSVTKPKTKDKARWENKVRRIQQASDRERDLAMRPRYSIPGVSPG